MMKIGLVFPYDMFKGGGVKECVLALRQELLARGHDVKIIAPLPRKSLETHKDGVIFVGDARDVNRSPLHTVGQISVSMDPEELDELLEQEQFDILHFHEPWVPILSRQILSRSQAVNIATFHAKLPETAVAKAIEKVIGPYTKSVLRYLDVMTAVSDAASEYLRSITDEPIVIIPNGIDLQRYQPALPQKTAKTKSGKKSAADAVDAQPPSSQGEVAVKTLLFVGRLEKRKGVIHLLEAYAELKQRHPEIRLLIAGDGPERDRLQEFIDDYKVDDVEFLGFIDDDTKLHLLQTVDLFCSPALYGESFGIVLVEAMASGAVVVAGNNPGYASVMQGRGAWSLVDPKDTQAFANRLEVMLYDEDMRDQWRAWALDHVKQFDYAKVVDQYEALYMSSHKKFIGGDEDD